MSLLGEVAPVRAPVRYAGFWRRALADGVDSLLLTFLSWVLLALVLAVFYALRFFAEAAELRPPFWDAFDPWMIQVLNWGIYFSLSFPYYVYGHFKYQTTLGKRALGVFVQSVQGKGELTLAQSISRYLAYFVSSLPLGAGFFMAAFHPQKRALHDLLSGTFCIRR
jgi:uncharacterized RDD family membrane protein YckC